MRGEFRVLGPVEVLGPVGRASLRGVPQRAVAGVLALNAGVVVSRQRLAQVLWADDPPRTAVKSLHSHVARVRQGLAGCGWSGALHTSGPGYVLRIEPELVDALRFERCVGAARHELASHPDRAVERLTAALRLWRGLAFADAGLTGRGVAEVDRLHELRLTAQELLWEAQLRLGRHAEAVPELERLLASHPDRERFLALYLLALDRSGRHADALEVYRGLRRRLDRDAGAGSGRELAAPRGGIPRRTLVRRLESTRPQPPAMAGSRTGRAELDPLDMDGARPRVSCPAG